MKKKIVENIYFQDITFSNILAMWNIVRKTCKNKNEIYRFLLNRNANIYNIASILRQKKYVPSKFRLFMIYEPKPRLVMSQNIFDKIVNHFVANYYLIPYLENKLLDCNVATRMNKGSSYAGYLIEKYINEIRMKYPNEEIFVLKLDISKYFYNIDHNILIKMLKKDIHDEDVINLIKIIIDETNKDYINECIMEYNKNSLVSIPFYKKDVGLSIGAMTSQFLAIYYLNDLDHFIKEKLKCKYYIRYMDDFVIFDTDKKKLKECWKLIDEEIVKHHLTVNPKSNIISMKDGISFIGYKYKIDSNNKFVISYNKKTIKKINVKLKKLKKYDLLKYYKSYSSYYGYLSKIKKYERAFTMKSNEKYEYYKEQNLTKIVFIKEGNFYKTYKDDAKIMWDLFGYKWYNDTISFRRASSIKVFNLLKNKNLGYMIIQNEEIIVNGDNKIYNLYLEIANINYEKYLIKLEIIDLVNCVLSNDFSKAQEIKEYLTKINEGVSILE